MLTLLRGLILARSFVIGAQAVHDSMMMNSWPMEVITYKKRGNCLSRVLLLHDALSGSLY